MRNLKRALSLALAAVMVLSMMVIGAGAVNLDDFSDKDKIVNKEAVQMLVELGVINGKDDGSYDPTGIVTRAEMAKIICVVLNGGNDPALGASSTHTYTDTVNHWAEAYIEYCTQLGIVAGKGDGTFDPNGTVTATEAAKMLLVAMGYDASFEGMVGSNWAIATNVVANTKGLYSGLALDVDAGLTRDNAAQMMYNAINAKMVKYDYALVTGPNGSLTSIPRVDDQSYTILNNKFGAVRVMGIVEANEFSNNAVAMEGKTTLTITNADELKVSLPAASVSSAENFTGNTFEVTSGKAEFGREVILYVKPAVNSTAANKATVLTAPILSSNNTVVSTTAKQTKTLTKWAEDNGLKLGTVSYYTNYGTADAGFDADYKNTTGTEVILIDNDADGIVEKALQNTYSFGQVTKYSTKDDGSVTVRGAVSALLPSSEELENVVAYDDIAVDDYVNVTLVDETYYITKAEIVNGTLDSYKRESGAIKNVTVDGTTYTKTDADSYAGTEDLKELTTANVTDNAVDTEGAFYLDFFGYAVAMKLTAATNFAYIGSAAWDANSATGFTNGTATVYAVLEDGTAKSYEVSKLYTSANVEKDIYDGSLQISDDTLYKYTLDGEGKIRLTEIDSNSSFAANKMTTTNGAVDYKKGEATFKVDTNKSTIVTSDTVFYYVFLKKGTNKVDSVSVYVGKDAAPSVDGTLTTKVVMNKDNDAASAVMVKTEAITTSNYMYVIDYLRTNSKGDVYQVYLDGSVQEITTNGSSTTRYEGGYTFTVNGDGLYDIKQPTTVTAGTVSLKDGSALVVSGTEYDISDAEIVLIDGEDSAPSSVGEKDTVVVVYETSSGNAEKALAVYVVEEYDEDNTGATMKPNADMARQSANDDDEVKFDIIENAASADILADFTFSKGYTDAYISKTKPADLDAAKTAADKVTTVAGSASGIYYLVVISESGAEYGTYKCEAVEVIATPATAAKITFNLSTISSNPTTSDTIVLDIDGVDATWTQSTETQASEVKTALGTLTLTGYTITVDGDTLTVVADADGATEIASATLTGTGTYASLNIEGSVTDGTDAVIGSF